MPAGSSPMIKRRRLGEELRELREAKGLRMQQLAADLGWSHTKLSRLENAKVRPDVGDILDLLDALDVRGEHYERLVTLARQANMRGWWKAFSDMPQRQAAYAELEGAATSIRAYSLVFVPGLLQTEAYARTRFADRDALKAFDVEAAVAGRLERQRVLGDTRHDVILDEGCVRRRTAPLDVWREQLETLAGKVQVLPFTAELTYFAGPLNSFALYQLDDEDLAVVETETADLQLADDEDVERYRLMWQRLEAAALDLDASATLIREITTGE
jgi:transcriptional regulator with XRE-family HTH domain